MMSRLRKTVIVLITAAVLLGGLGLNAGAENLLYEEEPTDGAMVGDLLFVRPFAILGLGLSAVAYGLSYPFSYWGGNAEEAREKLLTDPFEYAFKRPLGDF